MCVHCVVFQTANVPEISGVVLSQLCGRAGTTGLPQTQALAPREDNAVLTGQGISLKKLPDLMSQASQPVSLPSPVMAQKEDRRDGLRALNSMFNRTAFISISSSHENTII